MPPPPPPHCTCWNLDLQGDGVASGRWLGQWISVFIKRPQRTPLPLPPCEDIASRQVSINKTVSPYHCLTIFKFSIQFLKVTFHLHLLQNISYISHVVEFILEPILRPVVCLSYSITLILPLPTFPVITTSLLSISVRLLLFLLCSLGWFLGFFFFWFHI